MNKKLFCLILSVTLLGCLTPAIANADTNNVGETVTEEIESFDESMIHSIGANGERPIWNVSHRCNTNVVNAFRRSISEDKSNVQEAINGGCNGVEVDIRKSTWRPTRPNLILCHDTGITERYSETLEQFLSMNIWNQHKINLVIYDIKEPQYIDELIQITHKYADDRNKFANVYFVYSVGSLQEAKDYLAKNVGSLKNYEGIEISMDWKTSVDEVEKFYQSLNFDRCWYGNGIDSYCPPGFRPGAIERNCKRAVEIRDGKTYLGQNSRIKKVDSWSVNTESRYMERIGDWKLDCLLSGHFIVDKRVWVKETRSYITKISYLMSEINKKHPESRVRMATGDDNPFIRTNN